jgi:poly(3-hydroxybutyrate) depolymerase
VHDGCGATPHVSTAGDDGEVLAWPDCARPVVLHRLPSGGHDWPAIASDIITGMATSR